VPLAATRVTAFIDVHDKLLYWCVCAWEEDFTGYVIDYGALTATSRGNGAPARTGSLTPPTTRS